MAARLVRSDGEWYLTNPPPDVQAWLVGLDINPVWTIPDSQVASLRERFSQEGAGLQDPAADEDRRKAAVYQRNRWLYELLPAVLPHRTAQTDEDPEADISLSAQSPPGRPNLIYHPRTGGSHRLRPTYYETGSSFYPDLTPGRYDLRPLLMAEYRKRILPITGHLHTILPAQLVRYVQAAV